MFTKREKIFLAVAAAIAIIASIVPYEVRVVIEYPILCLTGPLIIYVVVDQNAIKQDKP